MPYGGNTVRWHEGQLEIYIRTFPYPGTAAGMGRTLLPGASEPLGVTHKQIYCV